VYKGKGKLQNLKDVELEKMEPKYMQWNYSKLREEMMCDGQEIPRNDHFFCLVFI